MELSKARELGIAARKAGKQRAPILDRDIADAVRGMRVGEGAAGLFNAYTGGWDAQAEHEDTIAAVQSRKADNVHRMHAVAGR